MNLLSKLSSSTKAKTIEPREIFMTLPSKAPGYGYPRDVQSEVWKKWFDIRNEKNVILKMNTGSGKTVVGLIMLQSCLNEEKGPAIYVVPDNYLVKQVIDEAKRLGISATEDKDDYSYSNSKAILVTSIQTIVNGYSYFGMREGGNYPIGSIIIDDVHACMDKIISQFMIKIDAESDAYKELIAIFSSSLKDYNPKNYIDIVEMKDCRKKMLVPDIFAAKTMYFRIIYGFRIELYDRKKNYVMKLEASRNRHEILTDPEHYKNVAPKAPTSIPQIRREFTARYSNGLAYLEAAGKKFDQPTHYARKIMLLEELYDTDILNRFIGYAIQHDSLDILSFKELLKAYNTGQLSLPEVSEQGQEVLCKTGEYRDDDPELLRDLDYYEQNVGGTVNA